ncbi:MAG TPA: hypothetical protein VEX39_16940 [Thermoleophilaceae bacterium]|nr:hypothetical protein [Thermoleophilaceae bacterium]
MPPVAGDVEPEAKPARARRVRQAQTAGAAAVLTVLGSAPAAEAMLPAGDGGGAPPPPTPPNAKPPTPSVPLGGHPTTRRAPAPPPRAAKPAPKARPKSAPTPVAATPPRPVRQGHPTHGQVRPQPAPVRKPRKPAPPTGHPTRRREPAPVAEPVPSPEPPSPRSDLEKLLLQPLETQPESDAPAPKRTKPAPKRTTPAPVRTEPPAIGQAPEPPSPRSDLEKLLLDPLTAEAPERVKPQPPPPQVRDMKPYERDVALTGTLSPFVTEGQTLGASRRLRRPIRHLQMDIDALEDRVEDLDADANPFELTLAPPGTPQARRSERDYRRLAARQDELAERRTQLELYSTGNCDYRCDVDAPYELKHGDPDDPYDMAAERLGPGATREQVVDEAARMEEERRRELADQAEQEERESQNAEGHLALDAGGFAGPAGPFFDVGNAFWYAAEGNGEEALSSGIGAIPVGGDLFKAIKLGRKGAKALDGAHDADNAIDAIRALERTDPARLADDFIADPRLGGRLDDSAESRRALADIFRRTSSGTRANAKIPGRFLPTHTRGHASELRTLTDLARRRGVSRITPVPSSTHGRTPDFVVTGRFGRQTRVEVTTVTGSGRGYQGRGIGHAAPPSSDQIARAIEGKVVGRAGRPTQFDADLPGVRRGGILALHLPGGPAAGAADEAIARTARKLGDAEVRSVEVYLPGNVVRRYVRKRDGSYAIARPQRRRRPGT